MNGRRYFPHSQLISLMVALGLLGNAAGIGRTIDRSAASVMPGRDKTGTSEGRVEGTILQTTSPAGVMAGHRIITEREGFEPSIGFKPNTAFPVLLLRPLGHLSNAAP
ncbi:MAG: hypothetical protein JWN24_3359 [Phycisphaerales bacterium]|nr:hypothetical protein [Phycisphaerales bacterium]